MPVEAPSRASLITRLSAPLIARLLPPVCPACLGKGEPSADFCRACFAELPTLGHGCARCAGAMPAGAAPAAVCGHCLAHAPAFDHVFAAFPYAAPVSDLIRDLKFGKRLHCARLLGTLLAARVKRAEAARPDCFIPIPLHHTRLRQRGFNQSLEITRVLSRRLGTRFDAHCLKRIRAGVPQTALPAKQRMQNPKGAFALHHPPRGGFVAIVDDVMTTGATVNEAARMLRAAGVARVDVWIVARTHTAR